MRWDAADGNSFSSYFSLKEKKKLSKRLPNLLKLYEVVKTNEILQVRNKEIDKISQCSLYIKKII